MTHSKPYFWFLNVFSFLRSCCFPCCGPAVDVFLRNIDIWYDFFLLWNCSFCDSRSTKVIYRSRKRQKSLQKHVKPDNPPWCFVNVWTHKQNGDKTNCTFVSYSGLRNVTEWTLVFQRVGHRRRKKRFPGLKRKSIEQNRKQNGETVLMRLIVLLFSASERLLETMSFIMPSTHSHEYKRVYVCVL